MSSIPDVDGDSRETLDDYYRNAEVEIKNTIDAFDKEDLLARDSDELTDYFIQDYVLPIVEIDEKEQPIMEEERSNQTQHSSVAFKIGYVLVPTEGIDKVICRRSNTFSLGDRFELRNCCIQTTLNSSLDSTNLTSQVSNSLERLKIIIGRKNDNVRSGNPRLKQAIKNHIDFKKGIYQRQNAVLQSVVENLPIKLKRKDNSPGIDLRIKKKIRVLLPKEKQSESQPYIEGDTLNAVIDLIRNQGRSFELTPKVFSTLEEEWLRDIILSMLNAVLEGGATGETFVKRGKTDIHLKLNVEGGILSAECKFWGGEKKYQETIDQHFGYLTWKQDYAIQITFSKNVDFSSVINNSIKATKEHPTYVEGSFRQVDKSYFITSHILLGDSEKRVEVHHFLFDLHV